MSTIADGKVVTFHYTLKNDAGEVIDSSSGLDPLTYLHGAGNIVPGLEAQLLGKSAGEAFDALVAAKDGYGEYVDEAVHQVTRTQFPPEMELAVGMQFGAHGPNGEQVACWVRKIEAENITVDFNHPLAGQRLHFAVQIIDVRDASAEEREHGHVHDANAHNHDHGHSHDHGHGHDHKH
jgi:FKBP-type peptidyl-prolyl cis-trans isomerase SlyD